MFQSLCGQEVLENVLLTTTQWSNVDQAGGQTRENNLRDQNLWGGLIDKGATLQRFYGDKQSGLELIHKLMSTTRKPLDIQDEIVKKNLTLPETNAGKLINQELVAQEKKFKEKVESLEKAVREAIKAKDDEMNQILAVEQAMAREKLENAAAEMKLLEGLHAAEVEKRKAKGRKGQVGRRERDRGSIPGPSTSQTKRDRLRITVGRGCHPDWYQDTRPS